jgi:hypothetical protein
MAVARPPGSGPGRPGVASGRFGVRWAVAARFTPAIWQAQSELAYQGIFALNTRLDSPAITQILSDGSITAKLPAPTPTVRELFPSEAAVASLIAHSINLPGDVPHGIQRASSARWPPTYATTQTRKETA